MSHLVSALAQAEHGGGGVFLTAVVVIGLLLMLFIFFIMFVSRYTKVGPNEVLIVSGRSHKVVDAQGRTKSVGFRVVNGGGTFVWPIFERPRRCPSSS